MSMSKKPRVEMEKEDKEEIASDVKEEVKEEEKSVVVFQSPNSNPRLPSECWLHILGYVSEDTEVLALVTSCLEFSDMLKERKTTHLLPFVIPFIIKLEYLSRQDILRCRLTTKITKNALDNELKTYFTSPTYNLRLLPLLLLPLPLLHVQGA